MNQAPPPTIPDDPLTSFFWEGAREGELRIQRCQQCGTYIHTPRPVCRNCHGFDLAGEPVSGRATLYSYSIPHKGFHPFYVDRVPYTIATVELVEQPALQLLTRLVGMTREEIEIGMDLQVTFEALSEDLVLPLFEKVGP